MRLRVSRTFRPLERALRLPGRSNAAACFRLAPRFRDSYAVSIFSIRSTRFGGSSGGAFRLAQPAAQKYGVGVAFIGKTPPQSYLENPSKLYEISTRDDGGLWMLIDAPSNPDENDLPGYLRRHTRFSIPESLLLEVLDENGDVVASEVTVTENISLGGAAVFTSFKAETGSFLRVTSDRHNITIIAIVRGRRLGPDGVVRLHIEFVDRMFPLEGIEAESAY